jgi:hypothetical protein
VDGLLPPVALHHVHLRRARPGGPSVEQVTGTGSGGGGKAACGARGFRNSGRRRRRIWNGVEGSSRADDFERKLEEKWYMVGGWGNRARFGGKAREWPNVFARARFYPGWSGWPLA